jgi:hypothetical protein
MTREEEIEAQFRFLSTQTNKNFRFESLLSSYVTKFGMWVDPCHPKVMKMLEAPRTQIIIYDNAYPITSYSVDMYGTSNLWHLIVSCSGFLHPHCIPRGHTFKVPTYQTIVNVMKEKQESLRGKVIEF